MISWNKGNSNFSTKRDDILITINRYHPDIFAIHEANYSIKNDGQILGYNIEHNTLVDNYTISRSLLIIKKGISYKRRYDLENKYISSIWVQINISKKKSILICSYYRQWSIPSILNINNSNSVSNQVSRYKIFSNQISLANKESRDIIILTDENIDSLDEHSTTKHLKNNELKSIRDNNIIEYSLTYHNKLPIFSAKVHNHV